jgi:hypothetical protein
VGNRAGAPRQLTRTPHLSGLEQRPPRSGGPRGVLQDRRRRAGGCRWRSVSIFSTPSRARPPGAPAVPAQPIPGMTPGGGDRAEREYGRRSQADAAQAAGRPLVAGAAVLPAASALVGAPGAGNCRHRPACPAPDARRDPPPRARASAVSPAGRGSSSARDRATEPRSPSRSYVLASLRALHLDGDLIRLESAPIRRTGEESGCVPQACHAGGQQRLLRVAHAQSKRRLTC